MGFPPVILDSPLRHAYLVKDSGPIRADSEPLADAAAPGMGSKELGRPPEGLKPHSFGQRGALDRPAKKLHQSNLTGKAGNKTADPVGFKSTSGEQPKNGPPRLRISHPPLFPARKSGSLRTCDPPWTDSHLA